MGPMSKGLVVFLLAAGAALAADPIPSSEAKNHVGETGVVCGKVADSRYLDSSARRPTFLNFDKKYPDHTFTAVIFGEDRAKFGTPEKEYLDKKVCVSGKIENYNGRPQMVLTDGGQIKLAEK
jgi:hypothetical protein